MLVEKLARDFEANHQAKQSQSRNCFRQSSTKTKTSSRVFFFCRDSGADGAGALKPLSRHPNLKQKIINNESSISELQYFKFLRGRIPPGPPPPTGWRLRPSLVSPPDSKYAPQSLFRKSFENRPKTKTNWVCPIRVEDAVEGIHV